MFALQATAEPYNSEVFHFRTLFVLSLASLETSVFIVSITVIQDTEEMASNLKDINKHPDKTFNKAQHCVCTVIEHYDGYPLRECDQYEDVVHDEDSQGNSVWSETVRDSGHHWYDILMSNLYGTRPPDVGSSTLAFWHQRSQTGCHAELPTAVMAKPYNIHYKSSFFVLHSDGPPKPNDPAAS